MSMWTCRTSPGSSVVRILHLEAWADPLGWKIPWRKAGNPLQINSSWEIPWAEDPGRHTDPWDHKRSAATTAIGAMNILLLVSPCGPVPLTSVRKHDLRNAPISAAVLHLSQPASISKLSAAGSQQPQIKPWNLQAFCNWENYILCSCFS